MPGFNQNGPMGQGAMTGRKMGKCTNFGANQKATNDNDASEATNQSENMQGFGQGMGRRRGCGGRGMGRRSRF